MSTNFVVINLALTKQIVILRLNSLNVLYLYYLVKCSKNILLLSCVCLFQFTKNCNCDDFILCSTSIQTLSIEVWTFFKPNEKHLARTLDMTRFLVYKISLTIARYQKKCAKTLGVQATVALCPKLMHNSKSRVSQGKYTVKIYF